MCSIKTPLVIGLLFLTLLQSTALGGWQPWGSPVLVNIDEDAYTGDDFLLWWQNWKEKDMELPQTATQYIDWLLLFKEAERMKLYESPVYRQKVLTFLKARTLMQLKAEEVDNKIKVSDEMLWGQYQQTHSPRYQLNLFLFHEKEKAKAFVDKFSKLEISEEDFATRHDQADGYFSQRSSWYRPIAINAGWLPFLQELEIGGMSLPIPWKRGFVVLRLQDKAKGSKDDFAHVKGQLRKAVWKKEEDRLTIDLLARLRQKFAVEIDSERLNSLDLTSSEEKNVDTPLISTKNGNISEAIVIAKMRQIQEFRKRNGFKSEADLDFKNSVVNGIIDQTLTTWEALAREYEKTPPFQDTYKFYCQHRMIKLLEEKMFIPQALVSDKEIEEYYQNNDELFTRPEVVRMAIIEGEQEELNSLWLEVALGGDFLSLAQSMKGHEIPVRELPANHLNLEVKEVLANLSEEEVSNVFSVDGHHSLVQLIEHKQAQKKPLKEVRKNIEETLFAEKLNTQRMNYLEKLKNQYAVELHTKVWIRLREELEQKNVTHKN